VQGNEKKKGQNKERARKNKEGARVLDLGFSWQYILSSQFSVILRGLVNDAHVSAVHDLSIFHPTSANVVCFSETSITLHINQTTYNYNQKCLNINVSPPA
jgi:hypothetical protein